MPAINYYTVTQTRQIHIAAESLVDAIRVADAAFTNGQNNGAVTDPPKDANGWSTSLVKVTDMSGSESY